jgi:glutaminase
MKAMGAPTVTNAYNEEQAANTQLNELIERFRPYAAEGKCASYIPALANAEPSHLGITVIQPDGTIWRAGNWDVPFTLQSISKVLSFIAVCVARGIPYVLERVDVEPTGDPFNSIVRLEMHKPGRPFNPLINAGAITTASILPGETPAQKLAAIIRLIERLTGKQARVNEDVFQSEWGTAYRNRSLAYYLKETGFLACDVEDAIEVYLKQCAIEVTTEDIAMIGLVLAHDGYHPLQREQLLPKQVVRIAKALMLTCGMYNASGKFAAFVGVPAKSGVSGGIMTAVPPRVRPAGTPCADGCGIGLYGPAIDEVGNSKAGGMLLQHLAEEWDLGIF